MYALNVYRSVEVMCPDCGYHGSVQLTQLAILPLFSNAAPSKQALGEF
jgi:hypothetical protein